MMQSCASASKLRAAGPFFSSALEPVRITASRHTWKRPNATLADGMSGTDCDGATASYGFLCVDIPEEWGRRRR